MKHYFNIPILSIDNEFPTKDELIKIRYSNCNNCGLPYVCGTTLRFVQTGEKLIWWHILYKCSSDPIEETI